MGIRNWHLLGNVKARKRSGAEAFLRNDPRQTYRIRNPSLAIFQLALRHEYAKRMVRRNHRYDLCYDASDFRRKLQLIIAGPLWRELIIIGFADANHLRSILHGCLGGRQVRAVLCDWTPLTRLA